MERHVPELYDWVSNDNEAAPKVRCATSDVVSWFRGVLQQLWIDGQACVARTQNVPMKVRRNQGWQQ